MLLGNGLPKSLWGEIVTIQIYLINNKHAQERHSRVYYYTRKHEDSLKQNMKHTNLQNESVFK